MKKLLVLFLLAGLVPELCAQKQRSVAMPPFGFRNSETLEIERIDLTPEATIVRIQAYFRPHNWIRISSDTYIRAGADGEKLSVQSSDSMPLDAEFYMPESGRHDFTLRFPPIDPKTKRIDLIESDCDDCFKIYDIELQKSKRKPIRSLLAEQYGHTPAWDGPVSAPVVSDRPAKYRGQILGYDPRYFDKVQIVFFNELAGNEEKSMDVPVRADGTFEAEFMPLIPTKVMLLIAGNPCTFYAEPGRETIQSIDLKRLVNNTSNLEALHSDETGIASYGELGRVNDDLMRLDRLQRKTGRLSLRNTDNYWRRIESSSPSEYKKLHTDHLQARLAQIDSARWLCPRAREIAEKTARAETIENLLGYKRQIELACRIVHNQWDRKVPLDIRIEEPDEAYYDFLTNYPVNDETALVCGQNGISALKSVARHLVEKHPQTKHLENGGIQYSSDEVFRDTATIRAVGGERGIFFDLLQFDKLNGLIEARFIPCQGSQEVRETVFNNPVFTRELERRGRELDSIVEANQSKTGFTIHEMPQNDTPQGRIQAILDTYRGKAVLVDLWETWCGPCRYAIQATEPLKREFAGKDIAYVYLASESSPEISWQKMIPGIPGEHYRLDAQTKAWLVEKYGFTGVPSYLLIDGQGRVRDHWTGFAGVEPLKRKLFELSAE